MNRMFMLILAASIAACSPPPDHPADDAGTEDVDGSGEDPVDFQIGRVDDSGQFEALTDSESMEIIVGFQGLIFIDVALRGPAQIPDSFSADAAVHFDDPQYDFEYSSNFVDFDAPSDGHRVCPAFRVPFGQDLTTLDGQTITLDVELWAGDQAGAGSATFQIVNEEDCFEDDTGETVCE